MNMCSYKVFVYILKVYQQMYVVNVFVAVNSRKQTNKQKHILGLKT